MIALHKNVDLDACKAYCNTATGCKSFVYFSNRECVLWDTDMEPESVTECLSRSYCAYRKIVTVATTSTTREPGSCTDIDIVLMSDMVALDISWDIEQNGEILCGQTGHWSGTIPQDGRSDRTCCVDLEEEFTLNCRDGGVTYRFMIFFDPRINLEILQISFRKNIKKNTLKMNEMSS